MLVSLFFSFKEIKAKPKACIQYIYMDEECYYQVVGNWQVNNNNNNNNTIITLSINDDIINILIHSVDVYIYVSHV